jgi:folate-binding protein YgfZ
MYCVYHKERAILKLEGPDTRPFLQGLITNNMDLLAPDKPLYAFFLTSQGRYQFEALLFQKEQSIYLDVAAHTKENLVKFLKLYKLRAQVTLQETTAEVWSVHDGDLQDQLAAEDLSSSDPRDPRLGQRVLKFSSTLFPEPQSEQRYEHLRLILGIPKAGQELIAGKTIPLEARLEEHHGIDFTKGCYLGQELQARIKHQGLIRKNLFPVQFSQALPAALEESAKTIYQGLEKVGTVTSHLETLGIAKLRLEAVTAAQQQEQELQLEDGTKLLLSGA